LWKYPAWTRRSKQEVPHSKKFVWLCRFREPAYWQRLADPSSIGQDRAVEDIVHRHFYSFVRYPEHWL
jgi:hypothetical protein